MDWATFIEKYSESLFALGGVCLGTLASCITLIASYFFQKWNDERKRRWELEDRKANRLLQLMNARMDEAQIYLNSSSDVLQKIMGLQRSILHSKNIGSAVDDLEEVMSLLNLGIKKQRSVDILNDSVIDDLQKQLVSLVNTERENLIELAHRIHNNETVDENIILKRLEGSNEKSIILLTLIHDRLDKLAQRVP